MIRIETQHRAEEDVGGLIDEARDGATGALDRLIELCRDYLLAIANDELPVECRAKTAASDVVQETVVKAHLRFGDFRGSSHPELLAWLRKILQHQLLDVYRHYATTAKRRVSLEVPLHEAARHGDDALVDWATPSSCVAARDMCAHVHVVIECLPEHYVSVVRAYHMDGLMFEEIASRMNRSVGAVRKLWVRALMRLQRHLSDHHDLG